MDLWLWPKLSVRRAPSRNVAATCYYHACPLDANERGRTHKLGHATVGGVWNVRLRLTPTCHNDSVEDVGECICKAETEENQEGHGDEGLVTGARGCKRRRGRRLDGRGGNDLSDLRRHR